MLRPYQQKDLDRIINTFITKQSILFEACVSYGKTYLACAFIQKCIEWNKKIIFCVNREQLVLQALRDFKSIKEHVSVLKSGQEHLFDINKPVQLVMLHSYNAKKDKLKDFDANILIIDEVHLFYGGNMMTALINQFPEAKLLGISGTCIDDKGYLLNGFDEYITTISMKDLINENVLAKPIYYASKNNYNINDIKTKGNDFDISDVEKYVLDTNEVEKIVNSWEEHALNKKTIIFASSIKHADKIKSEFQNQGFNAYLIHSNIDNKEREQLIKDFRAGRKTILINVAMLVEGFSDTEVECVLFACPTKILRKFLQCAGRGLRRSVTKTECIFLDCCGVFSIHGLPDDLRYFSFRKPKELEELARDCPICGAISEIYIQICPICGYSFELVEEQGSGRKKSKKQLERLVKIKSMQDEMLARLRELVKDRGYKAGYSWFLFKDLLMNAKGQGTGLIFYQKILRRIEKCKTAKTQAGKPYSLRWLIHQ